MSISKQVLTTVAEGERVKIALVGEKALMHSVKPYHPTEASNRLGHWYCVTHDEHFANQFQKDTHIHEGSHRLGWICHEHGIEQPLASPILATQTK